MYYAKQMWSVLCIFVVAVGLGVGLWSWGYWVGKSDTLALQAKPIKEAKK